MDRYVGDYDKFQEVYAVKRAQLESAYKRQQQEIAELEDLWRATKPGFHQKYGYVQTEKAGQNGCN